jgi:hypothetical protein
VLYAKYWTVLPAIQAPRITRPETAKEATNDTNFVPIRVIRGCFKKAINCHVPGCMLKDDV